MVNPSSSGTNFPNEKDFEDEEEESDENMEQDYDNYYDDAFDSSSDIEEVTVLPTPHQAPGTSTSRIGTTNNEYFCSVSSSELEKIKQIERKIEAGGKEQPCSICLCDLEPNTSSTLPEDEVVSLKRCSHIFHKGCIEMAFKSKMQCPLCLTWYAASFGDQPMDATMRVSQMKGKVPGHPDANGFHVISYSIPDGIQTAAHPRPGTHYSGTSRVAYLPNNKEGTQVLKLLQLAFDRLLIFTVGDSVTSGAKNVVTWNGIHHKTCIIGGPSCYGYPDADYLNRVQEELAAVGINKDLL
uniref:E3 ubiquitin-protein ligase n=1 Tax=Ditylenchus dipsaci TaxID=166011 RepID=A0A915DA75_9BILA